MASVSKLTIELSKGCVIEFSFKSHHWLGVEVAPIPIDDLDAIAFVPARGHEEREAVG